MSERLNKYILQPLLFELTSGLWGGEGINVMVYTHSSIDNSENKELLDSMVNPLEQMRHEMQDLIKEAKH